MSEIAVVGGARLIMPAKDLIGLATKQHRREREVLWYTERTQRPRPRAVFPLACDGDAAATGGTPSAAGPTREFPY
jgi:hypothetical protein